MTDSVQVVVHGQERLQATMIKAAADIGHMDGATRRVEAGLSQRGRALAPKRTGRLSRSVRPMSVQASNQASVGSTLIYAGVIHNGWPRHHISPNPFLKRALESSTGMITSEYSQDIQRALDQVKGA